MIQSDWGRWLVDEIEQASPTGLKIWYLGCNGFILKASDGTTIAIDPYLGLGDPPRTVRMIPVPFNPTDITTLDTILTTHEHTDHTHGPTQGPMMNQTDAHLFAPPASMSKTVSQEWINEYDLSETDFIEVDAGQQHSVGSFDICVESAHDPDAIDPVSYVISHGDSTFFHAGDSKPSPEFTTIGNRYDIDLGAIAFGSIGYIRDKETCEPQRTKWYATGDELIELAESLQLDRVLPTHWDMWKGVTADPHALHSNARSYRYPKAIEIVEIGDSVTV
jgi:L-ascorbate 6-phosphate lactonase